MTDIDREVDDTTGIVPKDEPIFLIRGQDKVTQQILVISTNYCLPGEQDK